MQAYWKLLFLNRVRMLLPGNTREKKPWKAMLKYIGMALLMLFLYAMVLLLEMMAYDAASRLGEPQAMIALVFLACTLVTLLYSFFHVVSVLFFSKDNTLVGALPLSSYAVFAAKLSNVLLGEIGLTALICAPLLIRFGIESGAAGGYYVRALLGVILLPVTPIALSALLSFLLIRISALWKRREGVTTVMSFLLLGAFLALEMNFTMSMDDDEMSAFLLRLLLGQSSITSLVLRAYPPLQWLTDSLTEGTAAAWGGLGLFAALSVGAMAVVIALCGKSYMRLALRQEETLRRINGRAKRRGGDGRVRTPFWALVRQEMREVITVPTYATNCLAGMVMFPVMILAIAFGIQKNLDDAMAYLSGIVPGTVYFAIAWGILCLTSTVGLEVPTAVSREGKRHEIRVTYPVSGAVQLGAKLLMGVAYNAITALLTAVALWVLLPAFWMETLLALAASQLFSLMWCMASLLLDVYHPKLNWKTEAEAVKQSMNAMFGMLIGFGMAAVLAGAMVLLYWIGLPLQAALATGILLLLAGDGLLWLWIRGKASAIYYLREYVK